MSTRVKSRGAEAREIHLQAFAGDVLEGLRSRPKRLQCKYLYDDRGAALFEEITGLPEYYPTRTEIGIMQASADDIARRIGPDCALIELGSGSGRKTRLLLAHLDRPAAYVPVDISGNHLIQSARSLALEFPGLLVAPVHADFTGPFEMPALPLSAFRRVAYFPGSTIGNLDPGERARLLHRIAELVGPGGGFLVGVDLIKDRRILEAAYNDARGVTRAFNLNLLERVRRELQAEVDVEQFEHLAFYNRSAERIEMHLVSLRPQAIRIGGAEIRLAESETIHTENSYKFPPDGLAPAAAEAGFARGGSWTDAQGYFAVQYFTR